MINFEYYHIQYARSDSGKGLMIRGEIANKSGQNYNSVAFRIILFRRNIPLANFLVIVNGLPNGVSKSFEKEVPDIEYDKIIDFITRNEIYTESAY